MYTRAQCPHGHAVSTGGAERFRKEHPGINAGALVRPHVWAGKRPFCLTVNVSMLYHTSHSNMLNMLNEYLKVSLMCVGHQITRYVHGALQQCSYAGADVGR